VVLALGCCKCLPKKYLALTGYKTHRILRVLFRFIPQIARDCATNGRYRLLVSGMRNVSILGILAVCTLVALGLCEGGG